MSRPPETERRAGPAAGMLPPLIEHRQVAELLRRYASDVPEEAPGAARP